MTYFQMDRWKYSCSRVENIDLSWLCKLIVFDVQYRRQCDVLINKQRSGVRSSLTSSKMQFHERSVHEAKIGDTRFIVCQKVLATITSRKRHEAVAFLLVFV